MSESKIQIKIGIVEFLGEGNPDWVAAQLDKILAKVPELLKIELANPSNNKKNADSPTSGVSEGNNEKPNNLSKFLRDKSVGDNQTKKFLVTGAFLQLNGKDRISTSEVSEALKSANQAKLTNASLCLANNNTKGFVQRDGKLFYVTPEGFNEIGIIQE